MSHPIWQHSYFGIFVLAFLSFIAFSATLRIQHFISSKLASKTREKLKISMYECGPRPNKQKNKISNQFYLLALLFILFDIEIIFMMPWAMNFKLLESMGLGMFALFEMFTFIFLLAIGFIYAFKRGVLSWQNTK